MQTKLVTKLTAELFEIILPNQVNPTLFVALLQHVGFARTETLYSPTAQF